jgi:NAD(P)-dependent dehydrogenase (short-subunit alcohol dehydrogenase family)
MSKSIIVTGAGGGIGEAVARLASDSGYRVGVLDIDGEKAEAVASSLPNAVALQASTTDSAQIEKALDEFGETPVSLVNNAGIVRFGPLIDISLDDWKSVIEVNLTGVFICSQAVGRRMKDNGGGAIVNMTSIGGVQPNVNGGSYGSAKCGLHLLTRQMAVEWGDYGIRVNSVAPGFIDGGMSAPIFADDEIRSTRVVRVPSRRLGTVEDIANSVMFLCSDEGAYINGHEIVVDGGVTNSLMASFPRPKSVDSVGDN